MTQLRLNFVNDDQSKYEDCGFNHFMNDNTDNLKINSRYIINQILTLTREFEKGMVWVNCANGA